MHPVDQRVFTFVRTIEFDNGPLKIEDIVDIAERAACVVLSDAPEFCSAIARGADFLDRLLREDGTIYGVTTGYGDSCTVAVPLELVAELPRHLYTYHGCGLGEYLSNRCWMWLPKTPHDCVTQTIDRKSVV